jgi:putative transposase
MERFFLNLKMARVWHGDYANQANTTHDIADYIFGCYNSIRRHSKVGNLSTNAFERKSSSKKSINLSEVT